MTGWRLAPAIVGWIGGGAVLVALGILTRRPDVVAVGVPLLLGAAWSASSRTVRRPSGRLAGGDQPSGRAGLVAAEVLVFPAERDTLMAMRVRAPGHRPAEALVAAEVSVTGEVAGGEVVTAGGGLIEAAGTGPTETAGAGPPVETTGERRLRAQMRTVRTGRRELFGLDHRAVSIDGLRSSAVVS
ncbi:MAG: hypothetical protein L0H24_07735, partial [Microlunatus sp.]|nr:hypothetical protein [Microlunatus sp.]